nr:MAG TPA: hypothetical protein [Caudoviricetes sp.]
MIIIKHLIFNIKKGEDSYNKYYTSLLKNEI